MRCCFVDVGCGVVVVVFLVVEGVARMGEGCCCCCCCWEEVGVVRNVGGVDDGGIDIDGVGKFSCGEVGVVVGGKNSEAGAVEGGGVDGGAGNPLPDDDDDDSAPTPRLITIGFVSCLFFGVGRGRPEGVVRGEGVVGVGGGKRAPQVKQKEQGFSGITWQLGQGRKVGFVGGVCVDAPTNPPLISPLLTPLPPLPLPFPFPLPPEVVRPTVCLSGVLVCTFCCLSLSILSLSILSLSILSLSILSLSVLSLSILSLSFLSLSILSLSFLSLSILSLSFLSLSILSLSNLSLSNLSLSILSLSTLSLSNLSASSLLFCSK